MASVRHKNQRADKQVKAERWRVCRANDQARSSETEKRKRQGGRQHRKMMKEAALMKRTTVDDVAKSSRKYAERELKEQERMERVS